jgi:rRNA-processing protein FCF1
MKIIIDTNALMAISLFKLDLFTALQDCDFKYSLHVLSGTISELQQIRKQQRQKYTRAASLALTLLKAKTVKVLESQGNVDDLLVLYSTQGYLILTQDMALKRRLTKPYLTIRQKKRIMLVT